MTGRADERILPWPVRNQDNSRAPETCLASVVLGDLLRGQTLPHGVELAVAFVQQCVHRTLALGTPTLEGVQFEQLLGELIRK